MNCKIAVVDDHHLVRSALADMISKLDGFEVVLQASHGEEFIELLDVEKLPDIAVIDLHMPIMNGYQAMEWLQANRPSILPLVLTLERSSDAVVRAVRSGARGFLRKNAPPATLRSALICIQHSGYYETEETRTELRERPELQTADERKRTEVLSRITPREMEFLKLVCDLDELTYEQIADQMKISRRTVDHYRQELFDKFHIKSKAGLVLFAAKWKLVEF